MKTMILSAVVAFLIASPVHAVPLTWLFSGTTNPSSEFNGAPIGSLDYELRIFLDTELTATTVPNLSDVFFLGPHQGEVEIETLGVLPVHPFDNVQYFAPGGLVTGVQFIQGPTFSGILFASSISADSLHLGPIAPTAPSSGGLQFVGPNGLSVFGAVDTFSAMAVPEAGSSALFLTSALVVLGLLRWRYKGSAS